MALLPIRDLGEVGVLTDISNHNLPSNAFTMGVNVRFDEGMISRAPVFRRIEDTLGIDPRFVFGVQPDSGFDSVIICSDDYVIKEYANGTVSDRSGSITSTATNVSYTGTTLADVTYINRSDRVPTYRVNSSTGNFADLTNWDANWRASSLRSFGDQLVALNITESGVQFPTRVRFSNITTANGVPDSWDATDATKSTGFNDLVQMKTPIVDGFTLGSNFIIYSQDQVWMMEFVGGTFIMNFRKLFSDIGMINQNCAVEIEGKHYVFGMDDIYIHDGSTYQSIADQKVKTFIFKGINYSKSDRCYVQHNQVLGEVYFCYNSSDEHVAFTHSDRCNRAAVYNYHKGTWSFMDLPNTSSGTSANASGVKTYTTSAPDYTYDVVGGSYLDQEDSFGKHVIMVGTEETDDSLSSSKLYILDLADTGMSPFVLDSEATKPPYLEREGLDLDEAGIPLSGYKVINRLFPQGCTINPNKDVTFTFGATDLSGDLPVYSDTVVFNWGTDHKIDTRIAGRYISYKMTYSDNKDFQLTGFDVDVSVTGRR